MPVTRNLVRIIILGGAIAYLLYLLLTVLSFLVFDHHDFVTFFKDRYPSAYRVDEYGERYFTVDHYQFVKRYAALLSSLPVALILLLIVRRRAVDRWTGDLTADIAWLRRLGISAFTGITTIQKWTLAGCFLCLAGIKVFLFYTLPFHVDETFNFIYFADQGIFHTSIFANNHTFTNMISALWWNAGLTPEMSFRLTSILSSIVVHVLIYSATTHYFNFKTGIFVMMLTGLSFWLNVYSVEGVSYMLMCTWFVVAALAVFSNYGNEGRGNSLFIVSCAMGFYTTQLFVIPFTALVVFWMGAKWYEHRPGRGFVPILFSTAMVTGMSILLYLPMYLWSGFGATFHSDIQKHDLVQMSPLLFEGFSVMSEFNTKSYVALILIAVLAIGCFKRTDGRLKSLTGLLISAIISVFIFTSVLHVYAPSRAMVFSNVLFFSVAGIVLFGVISRRAGVRLATALLCTVLLLKIVQSVYLFNYGWQRVHMGLLDRESYRSVNELSGRILESEPKLIFSDLRDTDLNFYITFLALRKEQDIEFTFDRSHLTDADIVIINNGSASFPGYEKINEDDFGVVYRKSIERSTNGQ